MADKLYWDVWEDSAPATESVEDTGNTKRTHRVFYTEAQREAAKKELAEKLKGKRRKNREGGVFTGKHPVTKSGVLEKATHTTIAIKRISKVLGMTPDDFYDAISDIITYENGWVGQLFLLASEMIYLDWKNTGKQFTLESYREFLQYPYWEMRRFVMTNMMNVEGYERGLTYPISQYQPVSKYYPYWERIRDISDEELFELAKRADEYVSNKRSNSQSEAGQNRAFEKGDDIAEDDIENLPLAIVAEKGVNERYADLIDPNSEEFKKNKELLGDYGIDYVEAIDAVTGKTIIILLFNGRKQEIEQNEQN